jgi:hypothetical protein
VPSKKPATALRRAPRTKSLEGRELNRALEQVGRKHERPHDEAEPTRTGRGIVTMPGRASADGSRKGAKVVRRVALYLPLEVADELERRALAGRQSLSDTAAEGLAEQWGLTLEAVG